jgi:c-di-GMP-related signal transduction protein
VTTGQAIFLGRQPILDRREKLVGYELLFRQGPVGMTQTDAEYATASVIANTFLSLGLDNVLGRHLGFLNVNADTLCSRTIEMLPPERIVIELLETVVVDDRIVDRCAELRGAGFRLALDDVVSLGDGREALLPHIDIVKLDVLALQDGLEAIVEELRPFPVSLLAEKVEDRDQVQRCLDLGMSLFQGYFFARPTLLEGRAAEPSRINLVRLLGQLMRDIEIDEIEAVFKHDPALTHALLRIVNSVAMGLRYRISSVRQAIVVLGRKQLQRWVQLLLFVRTEGADGVDSPLLALAATRGRLLELLSAERGLDRFGRDREVADQAFLVGVLSLLDAVLGRPLAEILQELNLEPSIQAALLRREGVLGSMLALVEQLERDDPAAVGMRLDEFPWLTADRLMVLQVEAGRWAGQLGENVAA